MSCTICLRMNKKARVACYPHMPIGKVWIYYLSFVCFCLYGYGFLRRG